ncbi:MAG: ATP-binding cassette domain-containing protein [Flavobacteriales bacterium]|jgi:ABC-type lipoprotein export system ATPase subunit|nr:MAG: ATP-binding cassette domain-containing protein [Flavobacteriales bacterium]|tara:strand:- start:628 stop:1251 length:624 start_codon:yes stop_codon:yes gene_type:complete
MIKTESLKFSYDGKKYFDFPDINLDSGENLLIIGNSGIGKTTLLHLLAGILKPESGSISISGTDISKFSDTELDKFRGDNIGIVFQKPHFISSLTINENLKLAQYLSPSKISGDAKKILESLNIKDKYQQKPNQLSEGEKQRASIALALINSPSLILADEPTSSLDDFNCNNVIKLLKKQANDHKAQLIVITHDARLKKHFKNNLNL